MKRKVINGLVLATICVAAAACSSRNQQSAAGDRLPSFTVKNDASGARILSPLKGGKANQQKPRKTVQAEWHTGNPPIVLDVTCFTYHNSAGGFCGVACTDNSWTGMDCGADIFGGGFDIQE